LGKVNLVDVGEGGKPCEDIGELFFEVVAFGLGGWFVFAVVICQRGGEFSELFCEVEEGASGASGVVGGKVAVPDEFLELGNSDPCGVDLGVWGGIWGHVLVLWEGKWLKIGVCWVVVGRW